MSTKVRKILVVDDEKDIISILKYNLEQEGYKVVSAKNGQEAVKTAREESPDLILLDIMMPVMDGVEACRQLRQYPETKNTYITFLTARTEEYSEVAAFDVGADDYITKPIKPRALIKRINALFRRDGHKNQGLGDKISIGNFEIDKTSFTLSVDGKQTSMPKKEFELLTFLVENPSKVFSRDDLLQHIWGADVYVLSRTVDVHIRRIREKIGNNYIKTIKGVGYKFEYSE